MAKSDHVRMSDVHGLQRLAVDAVLGVTNLVESLHRTVIDAPLPLGKARDGRTRGITGFVYKSVRGVTHAVGAGTEAVFGRLAATGGGAASSPEREAVLAVLNGVFGDYLAATGNPLAIEMGVRKAGIHVPPAREALSSAFAHRPRDVVVLLHGLCMNDLMWLRDGHDHGAALARDLGVTPVYIQYNTGRTIAANGRELDTLLQALADAWPAIDRIAIVGHSMGGLVARSAIASATQQAHSWIAHVDTLVFLGTPHKGAPLERAGAWVDYLIGISPYTAPFARLGKLRSAGIKDLRHGLRIDTPLPAHMSAYAIAASKQKTPGSPQARVRGDGLVPVRSAFGMAMPQAHRYLVHDTGHLALLSSAAVYQRIKAWISRMPRCARTACKTRSRPSG